MRLPCKSFTLCTGESFGTTSTQRVGQEVEALYLNGPAAGGGVTQSVREVVAVASTLIPREAVQTRVEVLEWAA